MDKRHKQPDNQRVPGIEPDHTGSDPELEQSEYNGTNPDSVGTDQPAIESVAETGTPTQTDNEVPKRGRGRPKGSKNRSDNNEETTTFSISEKRKVGKRPTKVDDRKLYTPEEAKTTANIILGMVQAIGVSIAGNEAVFNQMENTLLSESLPPLLERMSVSSAERTANILYPLCIGFASVSYGIRVYRLQKEKNPPITNDIEIPETWKDTEEIKPSNGTPSLNPFQNGRRI